MVVDGRVVLIDVDGSVAEYREGDAFVVQQGWSGIWAMPVVPFTKYVVSGAG